MQNIPHFILTIRSSVTTCGCDVSRVVDNIVYPIANIYVTLNTINNVGFWQLFGKSKKLILICILVSTYIHATCMYGANKLWLLHPIDPTNIYLRYLKTKPNGKNYYSKLKINDIQLKLDQCLVQNYSMLYWMAWSFDSLCIEEYDKSLFWIYSQYVVIVSIDLALGRIFLFLLTCFNTIDLNESLRNHIAPTKFKPILKVYQRICS